MKFPWETTQPLRVEVALNPAAQTPAWRDVSALVKGSGVTIARGGGGRHEVSPPGRCSFTLDNRDGAFSDVSGMALSLYRKRVRVSYRTPGVAGNLVDAASASFESGTVGSWTPAGSAPPALTNSSTRAQHGTKSMLITWGAGGSFPLANLTVPTVIGRRYTVSAYVWVPTGHPAVQVVVGGAGVFGTPSSGTAAWVRISATWTATSSSAGLQLWPTSAPTAGQQAWVDSVMVDEGTTLPAFTTTAPPISYRFTGRIATNDLTFPALGLALTSLTATDETAWQGSSFSTLRSAPVQEILSDDPSALWTLANSDLGDVSGAGSDPLTPAGTGTAPTTGTAIAGTTTATGVTFAAGQYYTGKLARRAGFFSDGVVLEAAVRTTSTTEGAIIAAAAAFGPSLILSMDANGKPRVRRWNVFTPGSYAANAVSTVAVNDGQPHHVAARWTIATGVLDLFVDGFLRGTDTAPPGPGGVIGDFLVTDTVTVGGSTHLENFTGLVAHAAITDTALPDARIADHATALINGFLGESVASRLDRYNRWAGTAFAGTTISSPVATVGHFDTEGKSIMEAVAAVQTVEDGMTYVDGSGRLTMRGRPAFTSSTVTMTIPGPGAGQSARIRDTLTYTTDPRTVVNDVTGTMTDGTTQRVISSTSIAEYGRVSDNVDGPFVSEPAMQSVLEWRVSTEATPTPQTNALSVRMSQLDDATTSSLLTLDMGLVVGWSGMPAQAPAAADSGVILGIEETYTPDDLLWTATVAPNYGATVMVADDPVKGHADSGYIAAY